MCRVLLGLLACGLVHAGDLSVFTIPDANPANGLYRPDIQASYPGVNWQELDVLCLPPAQYKFIRIGNLPNRTPLDPLTITNCGGQVRVGGLDHYYLFNLSGGSHWRLTGEYSTATNTGDSAFTGHAGGAYANSQGTYGILIDDFTTEEGNPSGLSVGGGATDFEVDFIEVRRVGFAGIILKTDNDGAATMNNVRIHDNYVHDTGSEGIYMGSTQGPPQHTITNLKFYNNRIVRTGTEIFQLGQIGDSSEVHHNVFFIGATDWKNPFQNFQNNGTQLGPRTGNFSFHHNIVIGAAASWINFLGNSNASDSHPPSALVEVADNYYSHSRHFGAYVARVTQPGMTVRFARNQFRGLDYQLDEVDGSPGDYDRFFRLGSEGVANTSPIEFVDNTYDGSQHFISNWSDPNQTISNISGSGNMATTIAMPLFENSGFADDFDWFAIELWTDVDSQGDPVTYAEGDVVISTGGEFYECVAIGGCGAGLDPEDGAHSSTWDFMMPPADDLRLRADSPIKGVGLLDQTGDLFRNGFE